MDELQRFQTAIAGFDAVNAQDPNIERVGEQSHPKELLYAQRMSACLDRLEPEALDVVRLAVRCQHLRRWEIPRGRYPMDRAGYHRWRTRLAAFHAEAAGEILADVGYDPATVARVQSLLRKERLKSDPAVQLLEDVACLVFLEYYFAAFSAAHDDQKLIGILRRTWGKMSPRGQAAALKLQLPPAQKKLIEQALAG